MDYQIRLTHTDPQTTAVVRTKAQLSELTRVVPQGCGEVWNYLRATGSPRPGRNLALYLDDEINLEVGVEVNQPFAGNDRVCCSSTPAGLAATTEHRGPYNGLGSAHRAIREWCAQNGHALAGPNWEVYGHWNNDPAQLRTDVFYLLQDSTNQSTSRAES